MGLPLSGAMVSLAEKAARDSGAGFGAVELRNLYSKSRPDCQLSPRTEDSRTDQPRPLSCDYGFAFVGPGDTDALSGAGVWRIGSVSLFRRSSHRPGKTRG